VSSKPIGDRPLKGAFTYEMLSSCGLTMVGDGWFGGKSVAVWFATAQQQPVASSMPCSRWLSRLARWAQGLRQFPDATVLKSEIAYLGSREIALFQPISYLHSRVYFRFRRSLFLLLPAIWWASGGRLLRHGEPPRTRTSQDCFGSET